MSRSANLYLRINSCVPVGSGTKMTDAFEYDEARLTSTPSICTVISPVKLIGSTCFFSAETSEANCAVNGRRFIQRALNRGKSFAKGSLHVVADAPKRVGPTVEPKSSFGSIRVMEPMRLRSSLLIIGVSYDFSHFASAIGA